MLLEHSWQLLQAFFIAIAPLPLCALGTERSPKPAERSPVQNAMFLLVTWCAVQAAVGVGLGAMGVLRTTPLILAEATVAGVGVVLMRRAKCTVSDAWRGLWPDRRWSPTEIGLALCGLGAFFAITWRMLARPTTNFDSLYYHLPHVAAWFQTGSLDVLEAFYPVYRYPFAWEVVCTLFVLPLREDFLVAIPNLATWLLLGLAVHRTGRLLGASRTAAMATAMAICVVPEVLARLDATQVDIPLAALVTTNVALALSFARTWSSRSLFFGLVTMGLMVAIKLTGVVYVIPLFILWIALSFVPSGRERLHFPWLAAASGILAAILLCCFWYGRNFVDLGNPFGHFEVKIAGKVLLPGALEAERLSASSLAQSASESDFNWKLYLRLVSHRLGPAVFVFLALAVLAPLRLRRLGFEVKASFVIVGLLMVVGGFFIYWTSPATAGISASMQGVTPWTANSLRFAFPCLAALAGLGAVGLSALGPAVMLTMFLVLGITVVGLARLVPASVQIAAWSVASLGLLVVLGAIRSRPRPMTRRRLGVAAIVLLAIAVVGGSLHARGLRDEARYELYRAPYRFLQEEMDGSETLGWITSTRSYIFYGRNLDRKVTHVASASDDIREWMEMLRDRDIDLVAMGPYTRRREGWKGLKERSWIGRHPQFFERVLGESFPTDVFLYRFIPPTDAELDALDTRRKPR